jgi:NADPH:quinone reductase-like Zn-dependent oxidoreductase
VDEDRIAPHLSRTWPLEQAAEAIAHVATGHARGKVVVRVSDHAA